MWGPRGFIGMSAPRYLHVQPRGSALQEPRFPKALLHSRVQWPCLDPVEGLQAPRTDAQLLIRRWQDSSLAPQPLPFGASRLPSA